MVDQVFTAKHPLGVMAEVHVRRLPLGNLRLRYYLGDPGGRNGEAVMELLLLQWRDWDKRLPWGVMPSEVPPPSAWDWWDDDDAFEEYCNQRMRGEGLPVLQP